MHKGDPDKTGRFPASPAQEKAMSNLYLGIDVAKTTFEAALLEQTGKRRHKRFANDPAGFEQLSDWLAPYPLSSIHICLEGPEQT